MNTKHTLALILVFLSTVPVMGESREDIRFFENAEQFNRTEGLSTTGPYSGPMDLVPEIEIVTEVRPGRPITRKSTRKKSMGVSFSDMARTTQKKSTSYGLSFSQMAKTAANKRGSFSLTATKNVLKK